MDEPNEEPPIAIQSVEQARIAAQCVLDWTDHNLTSTEAMDFPVEWAKGAYEAAKALVAALEPERSQPKGAGA